MKVFKAVLYKSDIFLLLTIIDVDLYKNRDSDIVFASNYEKN